MLKDYSLLKRIPDEYREEFIQGGVEITKKRVRLFCVLTLGIYFFGMAVSFLLFPYDLDLREIPVVVMLALGALLIHYFNGKVRTMTGAKINAYLFTILLLATLTKLHIIYPAEIKHSSAIYLYSLFLVSFTIAWAPIETIFITLLHITAYTLLFVYGLMHVDKGVLGNMNLETYTSGMVLLFAGFVLCFVIRREEAERDMENFVLFKEVEKKNLQMQRELELATRVHKTLIPKSISTDLVDIAVLYRPMEYIGGDYAKFHFLDKNKLIFFICDVTGHGVSSALLVNRLHSEFELLAKEGEDPGLLLRGLNDFIVRDFRGTNMYLSAFCCLLDFKHMSLTYSNHGHPDQYIYRLRDSKIESMRSQATILGVSLGEEDICQNKLEFDQGDRLLLFTDGVIETRNDKGEEFGRARLEDFIIKNHGIEVDEVNRRLMKQLDDFTLGRFQDDICFIDINIKHKRGWLG